MELLQDEPLSKLTVSRIAARADVSRQTFYLHFDSKEELLLSHVDDVFDRIRAAALPSPHRSVGLRELLATTFAECAANADSLALALQVENTEHIIERIRVHIDDLMRAFGEYGREDVIGNAPFEYAVDFVAGGVFMLLRSWIRDGLAVPAARMTDLVCGFIGSTVRPYGTRLRT
ncbi:TetR/AcrR family transcriptional regulator [Streptomyces sp. NPDC001714]|uniref:TetR/AcrR family transcriptional regulator n=1 Tax=Streptomyces sp. NPDC001714 TaxID=3364603 RepID=UPI00367809E2